MTQLTRDFISKDERNFKFRLGHTIASSLSGFIAGTIFASGIWILAIYILKLYSSTNCH
jgi:hypothetical protein